MIAARSTVPLLLLLSVSMYAGGCQPTDKPPVDESAETDSAVRDPKTDLDPAAAANSADTPDTDSPYLGGIDLEQLEASGAFDDVEPVEVTIDRDPAYKSRKTFRGWPLEVVMDELPETADDASTLVVQFIAVDGYKASVPLDELPIEAGVVAFGDLDAPEGASWSSFSHGDEQTTPAPYYVVWRESDHATDELPWAYKLAGIGIAPARELWGAAFPSHDPEARPGFDLFRQKCIKCHAVNRAGGSVGPELNVPMNVTEYFKPDHLRRFIRNAPGYRAGITMPEFGGLSESQLDRIIGYLRSMAAAKVCTGVETCANMQTK